MSDTLLSIGLIVLYLSVGYVVARLSWDYVYQYESLNWSYSYRYYPTQEKKAMYHKHALNDLYAIVVFWPIALIVGSFIYLRNRLFEFTYDSKEDN